jgi:hypothetical protein
VNALFSLASFRNSAGSGVGGLVGSGFILFVMLNGKVKAWYASRSTA